jgi:hypothetical protein
MASYTRVEVEPNDNCPVAASQVWRNIGEPFAVAQVRVYEGEPGGSLCDVTGWSAAGPVAAYAVRVEDSSAGAAYVVYGGEWGIRLRPAGPDAPWNLQDASQWGETHLVLADQEDLTREG